MSKYRMERSDLELANGDYRVPVSEGRGAIDISRVESRELQQGTGELDRATSEFGFATTKGESRLAISESRVGSCNN